MSQQYLLPVDWDAMQSVVLAVLKEDLDTLRDEWTRVFETKKGLIFSHDPAEDLEELSRHIQAYKTILKYYGKTV